MSLDATRFSVDELDERVRTFEDALRDAGMARAAHRSYASSARRFVHWLQGEYQPRNAPGLPWLGGNRRFRGSQTTSDLAYELQRYREALRAARLRMPTVTSYLQGATAFVHWLDGRYVPRGPNRPRMPRG